MRRIACLTVLMFASVTLAVDPPVILILPEQPVIPAPKGPVKLPKGVLYLVRCNVACQVVEGTEGLVSVESMEGPVTFYAQFTNTPDFVKVTYKDKYLYVVRATGNGKTDLIITPAGDKTTRVSLDVGGGGPGPDPPDPLVAALTAAYKADGVPVSVTGTLAAIYETVKDTTADDPKITNYHQLFTLIQPIQDKAVPPKTIPALQKTIGGELVKAFPKDFTTPIDRDLTKKTFGRLAAALTQVK